MILRVSSMSLFSSISLRLRLTAAMFREGMSARRPLTQEEIDATFDRVVLKFFSKKEDDLLNQTIGILVRAWAYMETVLDYANCVILERAGGTKIQSSLPISLKAKLAFFNRAFERLDELSPFRDRAMTMLLRLHNLKEARHDVVHGTVSDLLPTFTRQFTRNSYDRTSLTPIVRAYSLKEITEVTKEIAELSAEMITLVKDMITHLPENTGHNPDS
jgi:hypothetical protein